MKQLELLEKILRAKAHAAARARHDAATGLLGLAYVFSDPRFGRSETKK